MRGTGTAEKVRGEDGRAFCSQPMEVGGGGAHPSPQILISQREEPSCCTRLVSPANGARPATDSTYEEKWVHIRGGGHVEEHQTKSSSEVEGMRALDRSNAQV